jgi:branched-chain amino acid transport system ATP-binding protein
LVVDQFAARALRLADHVYVLNRGELSFDGSPEELKREDVFRRYLGEATGAIAPAS